MKIAVIGYSGAGKSTLVDMLTLLLKPRRGEILIDGNPSSEVDLRSWRSRGEGRGASRLFSGSFWVR